MSSRLIVKNLPTNIDEKKLKEIFGKFGVVTDAKVCLKGETHRRFCFIGYKNEQEAEKAKNYFNNTYLQMNKISVDFARTSDDPSLTSQATRLNTKRAHPQSDSKDEGKGGKKLKIDSRHPAVITAEQKFEEFKRLMKTGSQGTMSWNDVLPSVTPKAAPPKKNFKTGKSSGEQEPQTMTQNLEDLDKVFDKIKKPATSTVAVNEAEATSDNSKPIDECRLYVLNLPYDITEEEVKEAFRKYGKVAELKMPKGKGGVFRGFAYVTYSSSGESMRAFSELDNKILFGRILHIRPSFKEDEKEAKLEEPKTQKELDYEKSSYKKHRKADMKKNLADETNWNTLFLNPNTILETVAARFNIKKSDILDPAAENQAVRIAHAETQIIAETKEWMAKQGMSLDFLDKDRKNCERSTNTILIKNLSSKIQEENIRDLFNRFGHVTRFLLAPNKAIGVAQYEDQVHAQSAFEKLSYFPVKNDPLYLEWAPMGMLDAEEIAEEKQKEAEIEEELSKIIYVKNLNFDTKEPALQNLFEKAQVGTIRSVKIVKSNGNSQGYGFVEFSESDAAMKCLKKLQNSLLDGHSIQLSVSKQEKAELKKKGRKDKTEDIPISTKIVIRNLAFECTKKDVRELLKAYGEVKAIRLPKKMNGQHRGFAFAEFSSAEEAKNAFTALENTHLYGRKLAIEWAKAE